RFHLLLAERLPNGVAAIDAVQVRGEGAECFRHGIVGEKIDGAIERLLGRAQIIEAVQALRRARGQIHLERSQVELRAPVARTLADGLAEEGERALRVTTPVRERLPERGLRGGADSGRRPGNHPFRAVLAEIVEADEIALVADAEEGLDVDHW